MINIAFFPANRFSNRSSIPDTPGPGAPPVGDGQFLNFDCDYTLRSLINVQCTLINFMKKSSLYALIKDL